MAGNLGISVEFIGDFHETQLFLEQIALKLSASGIGTWMLSEVEPLLRQRVSDNFVRESDPNGDPWAALAPSTIESRIAEGYGPGPIQYRSGEMYGFFEGAHSDIRATQGFTEMNFPGQGQMTGKLPYKVGSAQRGNARTGAPARPVMGITIADAEAIMLGLYEYVTVGF